MPPARWEWACCGAPRPVCLLGSMRGMIIWTVELEPCAAASSIPIRPLPHVSCPTCSTRPSPFAETFDKPRPPLHGFPSPSIHANPINNSTSPGNPFLSLLPPRLDINTLTLTPSSPTSDRFSLTSCVYIVHDNSITIMPIRNPFARRHAAEDETSRPGSAGGSVHGTNPGFERVDTIGSKASSALSIRSNRSQDAEAYKMSGMTAPIPRRQWAVGLAAHSLLRQPHKPRGKALG